ncbi:proline-rich protein 36-like [Raphanus sativus]|uniref:Uncharacterized protein LOC108845080 n=1 Tax=Raphanus sativus TaxID=3726 RepID=A0A6J0MN00_RAPSA|nr:uncharacterized protein LOC108845080 [Raphanus sativus]KAJ4906106.1 proline-rich protein 36-like [Raphanus sativus]
MSASWSRLASAWAPAPVTTGDEPPLPLLPPDPPDPALSPHLSPAQYPPLSSPLPVSNSRNSTVPSGRKSRRNPLTDSATSDTEMEQASPPSVEPVVAFLETRSGTTVAATVTENFTTILPSENSPLLTNRASSLSNHPLPPVQTSNPLSHPKPVSGQPPLLPNPDHNTSAPTPSSNIPPPVTTKTSSKEPPLVERIRRFENKSLERLAPKTISASGRPTVEIPDEVFQQGAELHKDFIVCYFNGRSPPYSQIQSVLNHMWGKGRKLEIHNSPLSRTVLVRVPNDYLKTKILEKGYWYVGDSMFHTAQWTSAHSAAPPSFKSMQIWAHLTGVPLDLRHRVGLSLVAGLVGEPKETDDFTKNLVSLTLSHVKVEVDLTKPLPDVVEFTRQSGEVVEVLVSYPWLPPSCSHCKELGHIAKNCLQLPTPPKEDVAPRSKNMASSSSAPDAKTPSKTPKKGQTPRLSASQKGKSVAKDLSLENAFVALSDSHHQLPSSAPLNSSLNLPPIPPPRPIVPASPLPPPDPLAPLNLPLLPFPVSPPITFRRPSHKRSRSDPSFDSPPSSNFSSALASLHPETPPSSSSIPFPDPNCLALLSSDVSFPKEASTPI